MIPFVPISLESWIVLPIKYLGGVLSNLKSGTYIFCALFSRVGKERIVVSCQ